MVKLTSGTIKTREKIIFLRSTHTVTQRISCWHCPRIRTRGLPNLVRWVVAWIAILQVPNLLYRGEGHIRVAWKCELKHNVIGGFVQQAGLIVISNILFKPIWRTIWLAVETPGRTFTASVIMVTAIIGIPCILYLLYFSCWLYRMGRE